MNRSAIGGLASIIIPCWNQLECTRQCIAALVRHTRLPWELIVVDNGSTDGTAAYLSGVQDAAAVPVTVITNTANRGFPAAINQGLQQARGEYLVLLNNDVLVTDAWLDQLIALTTAKTGGEEHGLTAKDAKSAKEERTESGAGEFADQSAIEEGQRPIVGVTNSGDDVSAPEARAAALTLTTPAPIVPGEPRTKDQGPGTNNPCDLTVADSSLTTPPPLGLTVADCSLTTPPSPPFTTAIFGGQLI